MKEVKQSNYKLTPEQIEKAKEERFHGALISDLAKKNNVSRPAMSEALRGTYHKHVQTKYDDAIKDYDHVLELDNNHADAYTLRGIAHYKLGNYDKAIIPNLQVDYTIYFQR